MKINKNQKRKTKKKIKKILNDNLLKKVAFTTLIVSLAFYFVCSNYIYSLEYETKVNNDEIDQTRQKISETQIEINTKFSKIEAAKDKSMSTQGDVFALK